MVRGGIGDVGNGNSMWTMAMVCGQWLWWSNMNGLALEIGWLALETGYALTCGCAWTCYMGGVEGVSEG